LSYSVTDGASFCCVPRRVWKKIQVFGRQVFDFLAQVEEVFADFSKFSRLSVIFSF